MAKWEKDEISHLRDIATDDKTPAEISNLLKNFTGKTRTTESVRDKCKKLKLPYKPKKKAPKKGDMVKSNASTVSDTHQNELEMLDSTSTMSTDLRGYVSYSVKIQIV
jgi:transposase